jgi:preprotein translocase subunit SecE
MKKFIQFIKESYDELKKVSWPTKEELKESTIIVVFSIIIISIFLGIIDRIIYQIIKVLIK